MEFGLNAYHRLPDKHPQKSYEFLLALIDHQIKSDRKLNMKEKSVKSMMRSGGKDAAPAAGKQEGQGGKGKKGNLMDPTPLLCLRRPRQRVTLARAASPTVPATEARVRVETKRTHVGITSKRRRDA